jgi:hypothetical protein
MPDRHHTLKLSPGRLNPPEWESRNLQSLPPAGEMQRRIGVGAESVYHSGRIRTIQGIVSAAGSLDVNLAGPRRRPLWRCERLSSRE